MAHESPLCKGLPASLMAWSRFGGFIGIVLLTVPSHFILRPFSREKAEKVPMLFHRLLSRLLGIKIRVRGNRSFLKDPALKSVLFVCNHASYLDVPVLGSVLPGCFVAKSEVAGWPFIGAMSKIQNTVFIERRSLRAKKQKDILRDCLLQGKNLILFPEGTSSDGMRTLPFKSTLFSAVEEPLPDGRFVRIFPVSVICTELGGMPIGREWRPFYAWFGDMTLVKHVWDVFKIASFTVDIILHKPVTIDDFGDRKLLSEHCQNIIADGVNQCVTGRFKKELAKRA